MIDTARPHTGAGAPQARVAGAAPPRRAAAGRLPHGVPRHRRRRRRPAGVPVRRRPAPHRLERHRPHGHHPRARVRGGPRGHGVAAARPSASMDFGPVERRKHLVLTEVAATVAQLLSRGGNRVGALFFDGRVRETIPPGNGRNHVLRILARMLAAPQSAEPGPTDLGSCCAPRWGSSGGARSSCSSRTSSASRAGRASLASSPAGTTWWPSRWSTGASSSCPRPG